MWECFDFLKKYRNLVFPLSDAKPLLERSEGSVEDRLPVKNLAETHIASVRSKIDELSRLEHALNELMTNCDSGNVQYPMLQRLRTKDDI
ncbi:MULTISPECIES: MerR family DNA-binding protein [Ruegeria]|uniref:MerR family DNA-binding protein n=1 Tax=Ruegeria TaxID=97050 RepID=UPI0020C3339D|nr:MULTISPECIES: MerR family DNA-binding protein [Ruegeria]